MSYIGSPPKQSFTSGLLDRFTSTTGTTVTLTHDIASENDIVVFVNFVKQDSTTYSVGGTGNKTLTLGGTLVSSDIVEVHYLNIVGQTVAPSSGSIGSSQLTADVITGQTELASGVASTDELLISDAGTLKRVDVSLIGGTNTPAFYAYLGSTMSVTNGANTKVQINTEILDSDNAFDNSSNYRFTPQTAGKYMVYGAVCGATDGYRIYQVVAKIYKNGSNYALTSEVLQDDSTNRKTSFISTVVDMNGSSDYVELYGLVDIHANNNETIVGSASKMTYFGAYKIIE